MVLAANDQIAVREAPQTRAAPALPAAPMMSSPWILKGETIPVGDAGLGPKQAIAFQVQGVIGEGGMGIVYRAVQDYPCRTIALKALKGALVEPGLIKRFEREIDILATLQHPGVSQLFAAGTLEDGLGVRVPFLAMELVHGMPIDRFARKHRLGIKERLRLFLKVAEAVEYVHARGIVHRDLTCRNILVTDQGEPKVLDFGLATFAAGQCRQLSMATISGHPFGTLRYMSPEQAAGRPDFIDQRTDVYALGVVLYKLLTGRHPLNSSGLSTSEMIQRIQEVEPPKLSSRNKKLGGDLETIASKAMCKVKAERYGSVAELAADVRHFLANEPILARRPSMAYLARKFIRRHRVLVTMTALIVGSLSVGLVAALYQEGRANREAARANGEAARATLESTRAKSEAARANTESRRAALELARSRMAQGDAQFVAQQYQEARGSYNAAWDQFAALGKSPTAAQLGIWDVDRMSPRPIRTVVSDDRRFEHAAISPNQRWLALTTRGTLEIWNTVTNARKFRVDAPQPTRLAFSPDSTLIAGINVGHVEIWEIRTGKSVASFDIAAQSTPLVALGNHAVAFVNGDNRLIFWEIGGTETSVQIAAPHDRLREITMLQDGRLEAIDVNHRVFQSRTSPSTLDFIGTIPEPTSFFESVSPDGKEIATMGSAGVNVFSSPDMRQLFTVQDCDAGFEVGFSSDESIFVRTHLTRQLMLLGLDGKPLASLSWAATSAAGFSRDLAALVDVQGRVTLWATGQSPGVRRIPYSGNSVTAIALTPDGRIAAIGGKDGSIRLYDVVSGTELATLNTGSAVKIIRFDSDAKLLMDATQDYRIQFWDIETLDRTFEQQESGPIRALGLARSGLKAISAVAGDNSLSLWRRTAGSWNVTSVAVGYSINSVDIAPDAQAAVFAGTPDGIEVWSLLPHFTKRLTLSGSDEDTEAVFAENGRFVIAKGGDQMIRIWQAGSGDSSPSLPELSQPPGSMTSCDGNLIAVSDGVDIKMFDADTHQLVRRILYSAVRSHMMAFSENGTRLLLVDKNYQVVLLNFALPSILRSGPKDKSVAAKELWFTAAGISLQRDDDLSGSYGGDATTLAPGAVSATSNNDSTQLLCRGSWLLLRRASGKREVAKTVSQ